MINRNKELSWKNNRLEYLLTFWLIGISGINFFLGNKILFVSFLITAYLFFLKKRMRLDFFLIQYIGIVFFVVLGSSIWYNIFPINNIISLLVRIVTAYFMIKMIGKKFNDIFLQTMYFLGSLSLVLWTVFVIFPELESFFLNNITPFFNHYTYDTSQNQPAPHIILYTFNHGKDFTSRLFMRNSSCFTEPSTAMLFYIPALMINLVKSNQFIEKKNIVYILVILSSYSTGGYAVMFFLIIGFFLSKRNFNNTMLALPIAIIISYFAYINIDSFGKEINEKVENLQGARLKYADRTRLTNGLVDLQELKEHPIFGKGYFVPPNADPYYDLHRTNGTTYILNKFGPIIFLLYFLLFYKYFRILAQKSDIDNRFALFMLASLILIGFGNNNFMKPFFIALGMLFLIYNAQNVRPNAKTNKIGY